MKRLMHMSSRREQRGVVAIIVGLTMAVLVGFAGLALDGGRLYVNKTELQNAADACALAASYELTGAPDIPAANFTRRTTPGMLVATRNRVGFQGGTIDAQDVTVQFGTSLSGGGWLTAPSNPPATSVYVRCTIQRNRHHALVHAGAGLRGPDGGGSGHRDPRERADQLRHSDGDVLARVRRRLTGWWRASGTTAASTRAAASPAASTGSTSRRPPAGRAK